LDAEVRQWAVTAGLGPAASLPTHARPAGIAELRTAIRHAGVTVGSHTVQHPNLTRLDAADLQRELLASKAWLQDRFGNAAIPWLAYPYGLVSDGVAAAAAAAGYVGAFRVSGGWIPKSLVEPHQLPRLNVPSQLSTDGFVLRISGLLAR
jgi:peptidoglycan/xylan/chitin deacetylase (PgdA/CDA1 family)